MKALFCLKTGTQTGDSGATLEYDTEEAIVALIGKTKDGDRSALVILYDKTSCLLFGLVLRILGDRAQAEETLLDVYTRIGKQSASYDPGLPPLEWLTGIARTCALARLHESKPKTRRQELPVGSFDPKMTVAPAKQKLARSSILSLAPTQREILDWAYYSGLSCGEIAAQAGKPLGAVKTHARLGLARLGELFGLLGREAHAKTATGGTH
jgi:RNA polymerase sigma-70 factor (ECF subfamily)